MLQVKKLVKVYPGGVTALQGVDLEVPSGMFGLLGPNGAGKSTFMKILAGVLEPSAGEVTLDGEDILADPMIVRGQLGYLPQEFGFYPHLSGEKMLTYLLKLKGVAAPQGMKKLVAELLERVNLSFAARRRVKGYSGGMRQRLGIAQAIAGDPRLIIVDEPTAGLDPEERHRFYRLLAELAADRTVLLSTHIVEDVSVLCPRLAVISKGQLVAVTTPSDAINDLDNQVFEGRGTNEELATIRERYLVTQAILVEGQNRVRIHVPDGVVPPDFHRVEPTLEDAYMTLVQRAARSEPRSSDVAGNAPSPGSPRNFFPASGSTPGSAVDQRATRAASSGPARPMVDGQAAKVTVDSTSAGPGGTS